MKTVLTLVIIIAFTAWAIAGVMHTFDTQDPTHFYE